MTAIDDLFHQLYGRERDGRVISEGDIPEIKRVQAEQGKSITTLKMAFLAAICLGIANGAGQLLGGGGWPS